MEASVDGPDASVVDRPRSASLTSPPEETKDALAKAEEIQESFIALRERARAIERLFRRLAEAERAATTSLRRALAKAPSQTSGDVTNRPPTGNGRLLWLLPRMHALLEQRASQAESLVGVWDSETQRWSARSVIVQHAQRRIEEEMKSPARELCNARVQAEKLQRKYLGCKNAALNALRVRATIDQQAKLSDFASACAVPSRQEQQIIRKADNAFREYMLTKQAAVRHGPDMQRIEEQYRLKLRFVLSTCEEEHIAFFTELRESLQLAVGSLNVFSLASIDHGCWINVVEARQMSNVEEFLESPDIQECSDLSPDIGDSPRGDDSSYCSSDQECPDISRKSWAFSSLDLKVLSDSKPSESIVAGRGSNCTRAQKQTPTDQEIAELSESRFARLEDDRKILQSFQSIFGGLRESEDHLLRGFTLAQLPPSSPSGHENVNEALQWLRDIVRLRVEVSGALSTLLLERLLPMLEQQLLETKVDGQHVQEEQRRTVVSITSQAQARQQKLHEVPSLGHEQALTNRESEVIFRSRMVRILDQVRVRAARRGKAVIALVHELLTIERVNLHIRICDSAPNTLRRLAAPSTDTNKLFSWCDATIDTGHCSLSESISSSVSSDDVQLEAEERRVKLVARAIGDFDGKDGFTFHIGDEVRITLQVSDTWVGFDPNGTLGEFPPNLVEVEGRRVGDVVPDLVSLFKKLETEDHAPTAEDEEFASRFGEYLRTGSTTISERVLEHYSCALFRESRKVPLQGRIYFTSRCVGFFSHFNDSTILGGDTVMLFRLSEISKIEKPKKALIFQNSLEIVLNDGAVHYFTSFWNRDRTFEYLSNLLSVWKHVHGVNEEENDEGSTPAEIATREESRKKSAQAEDFYVLPASSSAPYPSCSGSCSSTPSSPLKHQLPGRVFGTSVENIFDAVYRESGGASFQAKYEAEQSSRWVSAVAPEWTPMPATALASAEQSGADAASLPSRKTHLQRPVQAAAWMRRMAAIPEFCDCHESWSLYGFGAGKGFICQIEAEVSGVPFGDYFFVKIRHKVTALAEQRAQFDAEIELHWKRSTLLQSRIEQATIDEFRKGFETLFLPLVANTLMQASAQSGDVVANVDTRGERESSHDNKLKRDDAIEKMDDSSHNAKVVANASGTARREDSRDDDALLVRSVSIPQGIVFYRGILIVLVFFICCLLVAILNVLLRLEAMIGKLLEARGLHELLVESSSRREL